MLTEAHAVHFSSAEFITIVLTALTAILACLAIVLALAGVVGYAQIRTAAEGAAERAARAVAGETAERVAVERFEQLAETMRNSNSGDAVARAEGT